METDREKTVRGSGSTMIAIAERNTARILEAIRHEPLSTPQIADATGLSIDTIIRRIRRLREDGLIHVAKLDRGNGARPLRFYLAGPGEDATRIGEPDPYLSGEELDVIMYRMCTT